MLLVSNDSFPPSPFPLTTPFLALLCRYEESSSTGRQQRIDGSTSSPDHSRRTGVVTFGNRKEESRKT
jgi:hypothetical protein